MSIAFSHTQRLFYEHSSLYELFHIQSLLDDILLWKRNVNVAKEARVDQCQCVSV